MFYHADGLGSIVAMTDDQGNIVQRYSYEAFGQLTATNPSFDNIYTYTGREYDKETGLYYYRARYYDAMEGRFISKDPVSFLGGSTNLYSYVGNNSVNFIDPSGLVTVGLSIGYEAHLGKTGPIRGGNAFMSSGVLLYSEEKGFLPGDVYQTVGAESGTFKDENCTEQRTTVGAGFSGGVELTFMTGNLEDFKGEAYNYTANFWYFDVTWTDTKTGEFGLTVGVSPLGRSMGSFFNTSNTKVYDSSSISEWLGL